MGSKIATTDQLEVNMERNYLYIGGPARSGTTALTKYLNEHPEVMICRERFKWLPRRDVTPEVFTFDRIVDFEDGYEKRDTPRRKQVHEELVGRKDPDRLRWMGDKFPGYVRTLDTLSENNPGASFILTYRTIEEVAESYEARSKNPEDEWLGGRDGFWLGIDAWNKTMQHTRDFIESGTNPNILVVSYHDFFYRNEECMPLISRFLDLEFDESVLEAWREESKSFESQRREKEPMTEEQQALIDEHADREAEAEVLQRIEQQYSEFDLYPPEAARLLVEERRQFAIRIAGEREAAKAESRKLKRQARKLDEEAEDENRARIKVLDKQNEKLIRRVRNLKRQMQNIQSSRSWKLLSVLAAGRSWALANGRWLGSRLVNPKGDKTSGFSASSGLQTQKLPDKPPGDERTTEEQGAGPQNGISDKDSVVYKGVVLPPTRLRPNGKRRREDDEIYLESTRHEVDWMVENLGLSPESSLLDVGCGPGRIALGILDRVGEIRKYHGVDVQERYIDWAGRHITAEHPSFRFVRLDAKNEYYNPGGTDIKNGFALPFDEGEFDTACLFSVFTHMLTEDVEKYLKDLHRVLRSEGRMFLTANLEDHVPDVTDNPVGYRGRQSYRKPLASVRYNREFFEGLLDKNGFRLERYDPSVRQAQRCLIVSKKTVGEPAT